MPAPLVLPAPSPPAPTTTQGSTFIGVLGWETTRLNLQGLKPEMPILFRYILHEGRYLRSVEW